MMFPNLAIVHLAIFTFLMAVPVTVTAVAQVRYSSINGSETNQQPVIPAPIEEVLYAREFELETGYSLSGQTNAPLISSGSVVVFRVDPSLTVPRQVPTPVLYAGGRVVHVLNTGQGTGILIGIVPETRLDQLADQPAWFGPPRISGAINEKTIEEDRRAAVSAGIRPNTAEDLRRVARDPLRARSLASLLRGDIADLILEFVPKERALAAKWRLPEVGEVKGGLQ